MRQERIMQASIFDIFAGHEIGCELKAIWDWLDAFAAESPTRNSGGGS